MGVFASLGKLTVLIGADTSELKDGSKEAQKHMKEIEKASSAAGKAMGLAIGVAVTTIALLIHRSQETIDAQYKLARQLGGTTAGVQALDRAGQLAGLSMEEMAQAAERIQRKLGEAQRDGMSPAADAFKRLGLSVKELSKMDVDERFAKISDRVKELKLNSTQTADVLQQLGIRGGKLNTMIRDGGDAIREAKHELRDFGVAVSDIDAVGISRANDAMTIFKLALTGATNHIAIALVPILQEMSDKFKESAKQGDGWGGAVQAAVKGVVLGLAVVPSGIHYIRLSFDEMVGGFLDGLNAVIGKLDEFETWISSKIGRAPVLIGQVTHSFGQLRDEIGDAPTMDDWEKWYDELQKKNKATNEAIDKTNKASDQGRGASLDNLSSKEREALEKKLSAFKESIAKEDEALRIHKERQLKEIEDLEKKLGKQKVDGNALRAAVEVQFQDKMKELIQAKAEEGLLTEQEILKRKYDKQLQTINEFQANHTITVQRAEELRTKLVEKNALDQAKIQASQWSAAANVVDSTMSSISAIVGKEGENQFGIMKAIAMATALVKGYEAAVSAYAAGSAIGGPPVGAIFAGIAAVGTAAIIAKLAGVGANSSGSPSVSSASGASGNMEAVAAAPPAGPMTNHTMTVSGMRPNDLMSGEFVREMAKKLVQYQRDGGMVVIR